MAADYQAAAGDSSARRSSAIPINMIFWKVRQPDDELMTLCDRLEASLDSAASARRRRLDVLLVEALVPDERELEAAE